MQLIEEICRVTRKALEPGLPIVDGRPAPDGACLYASFLLRRSLEQFADCVVKVRGGDGHGDGGIFGRDGAWHGHYWVEGRTFTGKAFVADITADQFGLDRVVVLPLRQARTNYVPGAQDDVDCAVIELDEELNAAKLAA